MSEWDDLLHNLTAERFTSSRTGATTAKTHNPPPGSAAPEDATASVVTADRLLRVEEAAGVLGVGRTRIYQLISAGEDPATGRRRQRKATFDTLTAARTWLAQTRTAAARGTWTDPARTSLDEHLTAWLDSRLNLRPSTRRCYQDALKPVRAQIGAVPLASLTRRHVEAVRDGLLSGELRRIGTPGQPMSPRAVRLTLQVLQAALEAAVRDERLTRNVAALVERPSGASKPGAAWTAEQTERFAAVAATDRLHAAWLRTAPPGGPWPAVDLHRPDAVPDHHHRGEGVGARVAQLSGTKTARGVHTLPLPDDLVTALRALRERQAGEEAAARAAGQPYAASGYVATDDLGRPLRPEAYTDAFHQLAEQAGLPVIRLHDARHTSVTLTRSSGWPDHLVALWHGQDGSVMRSTYTHSYLDDLRRHADQLRSPPPPISNQARSGPRRDL